MCWHPLGVVDIAKVTAKGKVPSLNDHATATTAVDDSGRKSLLVSSQKIEVKDQKFAVDVHKAAFVNHLKSHSSKKHLRR